MKIEAGIYLQSKLIFFDTRPHFVVPGQRYCLRPELTPPSVLRASPLPLLSFGYLQTSHINNNTSHLQILALSIQTRPTIARAFTRLFHLSEDYFTFTIGKMGTDMHTVHPPRATPRFCHLLTCHS